MIECRLCREPAEGEPIIMPWGSALLCVGHRRDWFAWCDRRAAGDEAAVLGPTPGRIADALVVSFRYGEWDDEKLVAS